MTIPKDSDWDIIQEFLTLNFCHYVDLNVAQQSHQLLYGETLRRAEETSKKIDFIEGVFKEYEVKMKEPENLDSLQSALTEIEANLKKASNQLFSEVEKDVV